MTDFARWILAAIAGLFMVFSASAERHAFVIGNSDYVFAGQLPNPRNDATDVASALTRLGYAVTYGEDLTRAQFLIKFQDFTQGLEKDDLALIFYAGHGLQLAGENYIVPVDAELVDEEQAKQQLVSLNALLTDLSRSTRNRIIILDACRNNPFAEEIARSLITRGEPTRGLAKVFAGVGSYIAFSTQPGNVALDGTGRNSPFVSAFLDHIATDHMDVHAVMRRVRADVQGATSARQIPWESSSLIEDIAFAPDTPNATPTVPEAPAATKELVDYHYVDGLDPNGDNFLALRAGYAPGSRRLATMESGTLLEILEEQGVWRKVRLSDGSEGWAHSNWIYCCKRLPRIKQASTSSSASRTTGNTCDDLWHQRNAIWHRHNYCFNSDRGKAAFGNTGCYRSLDEARAAMSDAELAEIDRLYQRETEEGCR